MQEKLFKNSHQSNAHSKWWAIFRATNEIDSIVGGMGSRLHKPKEVKQDITRVRLRLGRLQDALANMEKWADQEIAVQRDSR